MYANLSAIIRLIIYNFLQLLMHVMQCGVTPFYNTVHHDLHISIITRAGNMVMDKLLKIKPLYYMQ